MMRKKIGVIAAVVLGAMGATSAQALTINLINIGGADQGTMAYRGFVAAARYWESVIMNDVTLNFEVGYTLIGQSGPTPTLGQAYSASNSYDYDSVANALRANSFSALDASVVQHLPDATTINNQSLYGGSDFSLNNTIAKALGLRTQDDSVDATITFNTAASFDFNPTDGFTGLTSDFIGVAAHEMGHALGFTSDVGWAENYGGQNMDLFRYGADGALEWRYGSPAYFSIDGGKTQLFGDSRFEDGSDQKQPSHWLDSARIYNPDKCTVLLEVQRGVMDPTGGICQMGIVTALDLAAFDAIGWSLNVDVLAHSNYTYTSAAMFQAVPEPTTWAMLIAGFGLVGGAMRRRTRISVAYA